MAAFEMPSVNESTLSVPARRASIDPQMVDGGVGEQLLKAGATVENAAVRALTLQNQRRDADMIFRAESKLQEEYLGYQQQLQQRRGMTAYGMTKEAEAWWKDAPSKVAEGLENDTQRRLFAHRADRMRLSALPGIASIEQRETERSFAEASQAAVDTQINFAAANWNNPEALAQARRDALDTLRVRAKFEGWAPELLQRAEQKTTSALHVGVVKNMMNTSPLVAQAYYKANKGEIDGIMHDDLDRLTDTGAREERVQGATDVVMGARLPLDQSLDKVRRDFAGKDEEAIVAAVKMRFAEIEAAKALTVKQATDQAWKVIVDTKSRKSIPPLVWAALPGEERRQIDDYFYQLAQRQKAQSKGDDLKDDPVVLSNIDRLIEAGEIRDIAQLDRYQPYLSKGTFSTYVKMIRKRDTVPQSEVKSAYMDRIGKARAKWNDDDNANWIAFQNFVADNVRETRRPEDIEKLADQWFMQGYYDANKPLVFKSRGTFGEARTKGDKNFVIEAPDEAKPIALQALELLKQQGVNLGLPANRQWRARDEFYTAYQLDAERWLAARGVPATPGAIAAFAILKANKKPITVPNVQEVLKQMTKGAK